MKSNLLPAIFLLLVANPLFATSFAEKSLPELVKLSTYIFAGDVVNVRMTDKNGKEITDPEARTGPGQGNTLYLDIVVDRGLILKSPSSKIPKEITIPLNRMLHLPLAGSKDFFREKTFFLLDKEFRPVYPAGFQRPLDEQKKLESIIRRVGQK